MTSKLQHPVRAALVLAVTGVLGFATTVWAQAVHQAEVAGATGATPARSSCTAGSCKYLIAIDFWPCSTACPEPEREPRAELTEVKARRTPRA